ncbi:uncharacterized protein [Procambarus clarkii]|uniref:uncharacterized protein n=1 Tax=Procambarus clarkii TaxID=6728 RepID=UPI0037440D19
MGYVDPDTLDALGYVDPDTLDATGYVDPDTLGYVDPDTLDATGYVVPDTLDATGYVDTDTLDAMGYVDPDTLDATRYVDPDTLDATGYVDPDTLDTLPCQGMALDLTIRRRLTDDDPAIDWCCHLAAQLCSFSRGGYSLLYFHNTRLTSVGGERLLRGLHRRGVTGDDLDIDLATGIRYSEDSEDSEDSDDSEENNKYLRELIASLNNFNELYIW